MWANERLLMRTCSFPILAAPQKIRVEDIATMGPETLDFMRQTIRAAMLTYAISGFTGLVVACGLLFVVASQGDSSASVVFDVLTLLFASTGGWAAHKSTKFGDLLLDLMYIKGASSADRMEMAGSILQKTPELQAVFYGRTLAERPLTNAEYQYIMTRSAEIEEAEVRKKLAERLISTRESLPDK